MEIKCSVISWLARKSSMRTLDNVGLKAPGRDRDDGNARSDELGQHDLRFAQRRRQDHAGNALGDLARRSPFGRAASCGPRCRARVARRCVRRQSSAPTSSSLR